MSPLELCAHAPISQQCSEFQCEARDASSQAYRDRQCATHHANPWCDIQQRIRAVSFGHDNCCHRKSKARAAERDDEDKS